MFKINCEHCKKEFYYQIYGDIKACSWPCFCAIFEPLAAARKRQKQDNIERGIIEKKPRKSKKELDDIENINIMEDI